MTDQNCRFLELRRAYEAAFRQFSGQVRLLHTLANQPAPDAEELEEAGGRVEQARVAYRQSRDLLAGFMMSREVQRSACGGVSQPTSVLPSQQVSDQRSEAERLAYQLWEDAGRPSGKAEEHWYLAERLIRSGS